MVRTNAIDNQTRTFRQCVEVIQVHLHDQDFYPRQSTIRSALHKSSNYQDRACRSPVVAISVRDSQSSSASDLRLPI